MKNKDLRFFLNSILAPSELSNHQIKTVQGWLSHLDQTDKIVSDLVGNLSLVPCKKIGPLTKQTSINKSPTFALTSIRVPSSILPGFESLAATLLIQVALCAQMLARGGSNKSHLNQHKSAARNAAYALSRLLNLNAEQLIEVAEIYKSLAKDALNTLIEKPSFKHVVKELKLLRSLQNLAHGHRALRYNAGQISRRARQSYFYESLTNEDLKNGILKVSHSQLIENEPYQDEAPPPEVKQTKLVVMSMSLVKKLLQKKFPNKTFSVAEQIIKANQIAKHKARTNQFSVADRRNIEAGVLEKIDRFIRTTDNDQELLEIILPLLSGRKLNKIDRAVFIDAPVGCIRLKVNVPKVKIPEYAVATTPSIVVPVPAQWIEPVERVKLFARNHHTLVRNSPSKNTLKKIDAELKESQLRHFLPIQLRLFHNAEFLATLLCDHTTSVDLTKIHYFCVPSALGQQIIGNVWSSVAKKLGHQNETPMICYSAGMIGTPNCPDFSKLDSWHEIDSTLNPDLQVRQSLYRESRLLAYRGVKDPTAVLINAGGIKAALINDKNRGGQGQMKRLIPLTSAQVADISKHDELARTVRTQITQLAKKTSLIDVRTVLLSEQQAITPKAFVQSVPELPGAANAGRKLFINNSLDIPNEFVSAQVGWSTHGLVPFSIFSSLSPVMLANAMGKK